MDKKQICISITALVLTVALALGVPIAGWASRRGTVSTGESAEAEQDIVQLAVKKMEAQKAVDEMLQAELEGGGYTFESPLVVLDPYGESPLTALILFETEEASKIEIAIPGEDADTSAVFTFEEAATRHTIPVYGLYPDQLNEVTIKQLSKDGKEIAKNVIEVQTEPLPDFLDNLIILTESYRGDYVAGLNFMTSPCKFAFDKNGTFRWFLSNSSWLIGTMTFNDANCRWLIPYGHSEGGDVVIYEIDLLGKVYRTFYTPYGLHHDVGLMPNGNLITTGAYGETMEDFIVEIDAVTGEVVNTLDLKESLQRTRFNAELDWCHNNSIVWDEQDGTIIISSNTQCTVAKLTWPEGEVKWLLSDPIEYMPRLQQYLLQPIGTDFEYSYNQHHVTILPDYDDNSDTIDILLFDNGRTRFDRDEELQRAISAYEIVAPEKYSRLVHYRINEEDMTVEQIWQYGKERGEELFARWRGSAQLLSNSNVLGYFDKQNDSVFDDIAASGNIVEVDQAGNLVWDAEVFSKGERGNLIGYRVFRYPIYSSNDQEHDIYAEVQNLIPQEVLTRNN